MSTVSVSQQLEQQQTLVLPPYINTPYHDMIRTGYAGMLQKLHTDLDKKGIAVLENFIHPDFLADLRSSVDDLTPLAYKSGKRKPLIEELRNTRYWEITYSDFMTGLANDILAPFNVHLDAGDVHPVVGIHVGDLGQDYRDNWHFDATYLTMAMPIIMPPPATAGDGKFRIWPNVRPFSQSSKWNRFYWNLSKSKLLRKLYRSYAINFIPGNLYFFYGFRSLHGTEDLNPRDLRANCLMNFGGPFFDLSKGKTVRYSR